ncbi:hypothetical protein NE857_23515 [Nocardiopsis exhalans]|uniref:Helix-hairpin-helix domain-containing protein n=1 Tax=Nocardiopsis exhalans TaxID=163604 RepID=A0ABY5D548_9ACTN|nr:hypothetical protein [Nocardiopsis exhalans]USY18266.1 hypothetical protein NE857_23515 [Nocardiopsis exhalans]
MTTRAQLRKAALSHPETTEKHSGPLGSEFFVQGARFAWVDGPGLVSLVLPTAEANELLAAHRTAELRTHGASPVEVRVPLADVDGQPLNRWVRRAWLVHAPRELAERAVAAEHAVPGKVGDLPRGIGRPATQALVQAGFTTLAEVSSMTRPELLALHGVGPKAVRVLDEAFAEAGLKFSTPA